MLTKILAFPPGHFQQRKKIVLTRSMIKTILAACDKQTKGILFGPADMKRPFSVLIKKGLVQFKEVVINNMPQGVWRVTPEAIQLIKDLGIEVAC